MIEVKIIADSVNDYGNRLTTMQLRYPRFIHSEFMTHRIFSRNARSSRAVPTKKLIEEVRSMCASPIHWGQNQAGMQADNELAHDDKLTAMGYWLRAAIQASDTATQMDNLGVHKQVVNRILEPFLHIDVVVTSTEWTNFYALRRHKDAQPEIKALADMMYEAQQASKPRHLKEGQWHTPYVDTPSNDHYNDIVRSVARCARVSYKAFDGTETSLSDDMKLYEKLVGAHPMHASPAEHQATPDKLVTLGLWDRQDLHGNLIGWIQFRKTLKGEDIG